ncbi:MAG: DUF1419 domain-containing protein [Mesorhizobium sp.]|nr:MAG: DUF1419 domain-containing protein [Mesorhizobium sp.]RWI88195.1 MAG: DUF1419 domain-containing protein [Mesorhizobium sp.]RWJ56844.1 MAG: DUF1419 domain-containing protein [Mesorhizobium sp.]RWJ74297.1 MAG: DUF1419 domain-containing protein [Mesorhizobium sp.]
MSSTSHGTSPMHQLPDAKNDRDQHYRNLNLWQRLEEPASCMLGKFWKIDEATYDEFENLLPPRYCAGGFRMSERLTGDIAATFIRVGQDYWCGFTDLNTTPATHLVAHIALL